MRLWLRFSRAELLTFISHLDAHRAYFRLFKRAQLPLKYSQGFNPHPLISLAVPLSLGFHSQSDYVDMYLSERMELTEVVQRLQDAAGSQMLKLMGAVEVFERTKPLASLARAARYRITLQDIERDVVQKACTMFHQSPEVMFIKQTKRSSKEMDARQMVFELECSGQELNGVLSLGEVGNLRPDELLPILSSFAGTELVMEHVLREEIYIQGDTLLSPLEWAALGSDKTG